MHVDNQSNVLNRTYTYSSTQNDGRIETMVDAVSGETVQYQYDSLKRLISAETTGTQWGQSFSYDGFGNLLAQTVTKGSAPSLSVLVSGTTNRITSAGYSYDSNGNLTAAPGLTMSYDVENRMSSAASASGTEWYAYDPMNRRTEKGASGSEYGDKYLYDVDGSLLGTYRRTNGPFRGDSWAVNVYFAGRQIWQAWTSGYPYARGTSPDRLGSTVKHFPFGDEASATTPNREKFATYYRDEVTALDYARNRYYSSTIARFTTADPYLASGGPADPQSWNRYAYVQGDPVNFNDPVGLARCPDGYSRGWWSGGDTPCYPKSWLVDRFSWPQHDDDQGPAWVTEAKWDLRFPRFSIPKGVGEAMQIARAALRSPDCGALFNTDPNREHRYSAQDVLFSMVMGVPLGGVNLGTVRVDRLQLAYAAVTVGGPDLTPNGAEGRATSADIVLQANPLSNAYWWDRTPAQLAVTLLHELGHVFNIVTSLGGSAIRYDLNPDLSVNSEAEAANAAALQKCFP